MKGSLDSCLVFDRSKTVTYDVAGFGDSDYAADLDHGAIIQATSSLGVFIGPNSDRARLD